MWVLLCVFGTITSQNVAIWFAPTTTTITAYNQHCYRVRFRQPESRVVTRPPWNSCSAAQLPGEHLFMRLSVEAIERADRWNKAAGWSVKHNSTAESNAGYYTRRLRCKHQSIVVWCRFESVVVRVPVSYCFNLTDAFGYQIRGCDRCKTRMNHQYLRNWWDHTSM